jgi:glycosyltransferase involved in cell wall biosynthesis
MTLISVVIPAYNEAAHIQACLHETALALRGLDYEIIAVDDGSRDATYEEMLTAASTNIRICPVCQPSNLGKGAALLFGCQHATGVMIAFLDADLELHPRQLLSFIKVMQETEADVVIGSKRHHDSRLTYPWFRHITSIAYSQMVQFLFGLDLRDTQTGIKLFRASVLHRVIPRLRVRRFAFDLELLVACNRFGYKIVPVPVVVSFQRAHSGRIGALAISRMFVDTLRILYQASFWKWLEPSLRVRFWMVGFVLGLVMASFGIAHWLTLYISIPPQLSGFVWLLTFKFVNLHTRDWIMIVLGIVLVIWALIELNKSLLAAFARADQGDLAGIMRKDQDSRHNKKPTE